MDQFKQIKPITDLTAEEAIALLKQPPEQLVKTAYTRDGLIIRLVVLCHAAGSTKAKNFLEFLLREGSDEDKKLVEAVYAP